MSDGVDTVAEEHEVDSHSSLHADTGNTSKNLENEEALDPDGEPALNTNYDSSDGSLLVFRCERCDNYETLNKEAFCAHQDQCLVAGDGGENTEVIEGTENDIDGDGTSGHRSHRKMFECDVCNMKFSNGANMRRHKMRHTGVKPYECRICQKRFFRKDHLAEHFTTHSKTLPYHCPICNRGFQRQIAMRAHFQNEHVGQHDMVKSCPLCHYRASTMKCLRLHFFNRHGIDLDNPGPNSSTSILSNCSGENVPPAPLSDSGDSTGNRSTDNATPPMHFLTPHVEISIPYPEQTNSQHNTSSALLNGDSPSSPQSADSNSNVPSSSHHHLPIKTSMTHKNLSSTDEGITPSISLIPIKQEPNSNGLDESSATCSSLPLQSIIKVSPLKSLLRDDLRRKMSGTCNNNNNNGSNMHSRGEPLSSSRQESRTSGMQCTHCKITFPDQTLYFLHKGCHSESNPWKCNICGEQCCNLYQFNSHLLSKSHQ